LIAIPDYTNLSRFHASIMNDYTALLLALYDYATAPTHPFQGVKRANSSDVWQGYILHRADTLRYAYDLIEGRAVTGHIHVFVNEVDVYDAAVAGYHTGTVDISGLSLTAGQVYPVRVTNVGGYKCTVDWLGETKTIGYTAPPSFSDTNVLDASDLQAIHDSIAEVQSAIERGCMPFPWANSGMPGHHNGVICAGSNASRRPGYWGVFHAHDTLRYRYRHGAQNFQIHTKVYVNGAEFQSIKEGTFDTLHAGTWDLSGLGLTKGQIYTVEFTTELDGTVREDEIFCVVYQLSEESDLTVTPPPIWAHGGQNIDAANLNRYSAILDAIHPGAASPTAPAYYEAPAVRTPDSYRYRIQHRYRWLRYVTRSGKTTEMTYGGGQTKVKLPTGSGNQTYDLTQVPNLGLGEYYDLDDAYYAEEADSSQ
jgi:hypothetical protein